MFWHPSQENVCRILCHGAASKELSEKDAHFADVLNLNLRVQPTFLAWLLPRAVPRAGFGSHVRTCIPLCKAMGSVVEAILKGQKPLWLRSCTSQTC